MNEFIKMGLIPQIIKVINELNFNSPTLIQQKSIPNILKSEKDFIVLSQTGTGKTAAFGLPLVQKVLQNQKKPQVLILCPTRELCLQITKDFQKFTKYISSIRTTPIYGGSNIETQIKNLEKGSQIIISTPGRLVDLIHRKKINLSNIRYFVLDEADEMLNMGFKDDLDFIIKEIPPHRQTLLFSATMSKNIEKIIKNYLVNPFEISAGKRNIGSDNINHFYYIINNKNKYLALKRIIDINPNIYGIIFCRTKKETKEISDNLISDGYNVDSIYGDLSQIQRESVMNRFRKKRLQLLIATDVAARGLDVNNITHIINYNLPNDNETYLHRSGRTGRAGNEGISISIIYNKEYKLLKEIEKKIEKKFKYSCIPTGKEICEKQLFNFIKKITELTIDDFSIKNYLPMIYEKLENFNREELIKRFTLAQFNHFLFYYKNTKDINFSTNSNFIEHSSRQKSNVSSNFFNLSINLGIKDGLTKKDLINFIKKSIHIQNINIRNIKISNKNSFFEIDSIYYKKIISTLDKKNYKGKLLFVKYKNKNKFFFNSRKKVYNKYKSKISFTKRKKYK